jgi:hypothetical protein
MELQCSTKIKLQKHNKTLILLYFISTFITKKLISHIHYSQHFQKKKSLIIPRALKLNHDVAKYIAKYI